MLFEMEFQNTVTSGSMPLAEWDVSIGSDVRHSLTYGIWGRGSWWRVGWRWTAEFVRSGRQPSFASDAARVAWP